MKVAPRDVIEYSGRELLGIPIARGETIEDFLTNLLTLLWREGEAFDAKRPFGDSGWQWDVYKALIEAKAIEGVLDEWGDVESVDTLKADILAERAIEALVRR